MNPDIILPVAKPHLLLANAVVLGASGVKILVTGIQSYLAIRSSQSILAFLPLRGWILVIFMMCLGISLKFTPGFRRSLRFLLLRSGSALIAAGTRFLSR